MGPGNVCVFEREPMLKAIAKSFGGRYNPKYKNWVIPVGAKSALLEQLIGIGATAEFGKIVR